MGANWKCRTRSGRLCAIGVAAATLYGCRGGYDFPMVPVRGQITFAGGSCPAAGNITFSPLEVEAGSPRRPGSAIFDKDGRFVITSFREGDGLIAGRYKVSITCFSGLPDPSKPDPWGDVSYVPNDFHPPELVVERDSKPIELAYDVPAKKKK
jgi:hypothetical protein